LGIWKDEHIPELRHLTQLVRNQGAVAGVQLAHAGRKGSTFKPWAGSGVVMPEAGGWEPVAAPSALSFASNYRMPEALDDQGMARIRTAFVHAAQRALAAGYQVVEIHAAHGYLLHEFLSPIANQRTDLYGGPFENRVRLLLEVVREVRAVWPDALPVFVRLSTTDWLADNAWNLDECVKLVCLLQNLGVDLVDCSSGGILPDVKIPTGPGYQTKNAGHIRRETGVLTGAVGMITSAAQAEHILRTGQADLIIVGRQFLRDPYWPLHAARELGEKVQWPSPYLRADE
jgi:2,4-dienoyl-CoA reductase-like NADH-dependent reductase (Old Yellow Enzyme family)